MKPTHRIAIISTVGIVSACAAFGTPHDDFVNRMYDCANKNKCMNFWLDEVMADAPKALNGDRIYIIPIKPGDKVPMPQGGFVGEGATTLLSNWIIIRAQPSAARMIAVLEDEISHQKGKRHENDTRGIVVDERAAAWASQRERALSRGMP